MNEVSLKPVIEELENLFSKFNTRFFVCGVEIPERDQYPCRCHEAEDHAGTAVPRFPLYGW